MLTIQQTEQNLKSYIEMAVKKAGSQRKLSTILGMGEAYVCKTLQKKLMPLLELVKKIEEKQILDKKFVDVFGNKQ